MLERETDLPEPALNVVENGADLPPLDVRRHVEAPEDVFAMQYLGVGAIRTSATLSKRT
jgi:hypothetical protein